MFQLSAVAAATRWRSAVKNFWLGICLILASGSSFAIAAEPATVLVTGAKEGLIYPSL